MALKVMVSKIRPSKIEVKKKKPSQKIIPVIDSFEFHVLMGLALLRFGIDISPCRRLTWADCVDVYNGRLYLWFNTPDESTHIVSIKEAENER